MKIFADRTLPIRREPGVSLDVPEPKTKTEIAQISQAIVSAALTGELPSSQAFALFKLLELHWRVLENSAPTLSGDTAAPDADGDLIRLSFAKGLKQFGDKIVFATLHYLSLPHEKGEADRSIKRKEKACSSSTASDINIRKTNCSTSLV
jgi:hypothetical protein